MSSAVRASMILFLCSMVSSDFPVMLRILRLWAFPEEDRAPVIALNMTGDRSALLSVSNGVYDRAEMFRTMLKPRQVAATSSIGSTS